MSNDTDVAVLKSEMIYVKEVCKNNTDSINKLNISINNLTTALDNNTALYKEQQSYIEKQKNKPSQWVDKILWTILGAVIAYILKTSFGI